MDIRIPYRPSKTLIVGVIAFFGVCSAVFAYLALAGDRGLSLFRLISLTAEQAVPAFWVLFGLSSLFVVAGIAMLVYSGKNKREIVFKDGELQFPKKGWNRDYIYIKYADIIQADEVKIQSTKIFNVYFQHGQISLPTSLVPNKTYYEQFKAELARRVNG